MEKDYLSISQRNKISNHKEVYIILRSIVLLKLCQAIEKITQQLYNKELNKLKKKYDVFTSMIPNFSINQFCKDFNIPQSEIQGAFAELNPNSKNTGLANICMQLSATFFEVIDSSEMNAQQLKELFERYISRLKIGLNYCKDQQFAKTVQIIINLVQKHLSVKQSNQQISQHYLSELKSQVRKSYDLFFLHINY